MPHDQCPPSRRGHTWKALPLSKGIPAGDWLEMRQCARCGANGRVSKQGVIHVVENR